MSSASIFGRSTNQPAIPNRRACAKQEEILLMKGDNNLANDRMAGNRRLRRFYN
jgi:hypothetical protein